MLTAVTTDNSLAIFEIHGTAKGSFYKLVFAKQSHNSRHRPLLYYKMSINQTRDGETYGTVRKNFSVNTHLKYWTFLGYRKLRFSQFLCASKPWAEDRNLEDMFMTQIHKKNVLVFGIFSGNLGISLSTRNKNQFYSVLE